MNLWTRDRANMPSRRREHDAAGNKRVLPVFDRARAESINPEARTGLNGATGSIFGTFRETRRRPPREVVTAKLLGDPSVDRVVPSIADDPDPRGRNQPAPVYLTFSAMQAAYGEIECGS